MIGFVIVVVNRDTHGESFADFIITSCEDNRTHTTNGINITTTNVQIGQPFDQIFKYVSSLPILNRVIIYSNESFLLINISKNMVDSF